MSEIISKVEQYSKGILKEELPDGIYFHNLEHTERVVKAAIEIGNSESLTAEEMEILVIAAWMHDLGYSKSKEFHEEMSIQIARLFLFQNEYPAEKIKEVVQCIRVTQMPQNPKSKLEKIICDADLHHLSQPGFVESSEKLRNELSATFEEGISKKQWMITNLSFLEEHEYFTDYARKTLSEGKNENISKIKKEVVDLKQTPEYEEELKNQERRLQKIFKSKKANKPVRGVETMIRVTSKNHVQLSHMADNKANILISVNAIILSVVISILIRKFEESPYLIIPTLILVFTCLSAIVFAVLSTRPNVSKGTFSRKDIEEKKTNLLFFGNFHGVQLTDYMWGMKEMLKSGDYLYTSLIKDIYFIGKVLGRKYELLRFSYIIFMFGLIISVLAYLVSGYISYRF